MAKKWHLLALSLLASTLLGCQNHQPSKLGSSYTSNQLLHPLRKNGMRRVAVFSHREPHQAYRVIGTASIAKNDIFGMPRKPLMIMRLMQKQAHKMGGDGVVQIRMKDNTVEGKVIAYQKILI